jgi:S-adenosylmethionine hydrolase
MIVLLTDFGQGEYVGIMKAVILGVNKDARIVDLCHTIRPQCLIEASWILKNSYPYFPKSATFCCVVDPGVGSNRRAIAVRTEDYCFVAPDNGLVWEALKAETVVEIRALGIPEGASRTFHGRDVFAGAAAKADLGRFTELGETIDRLTELELYRNGRQGIVVRIDPFGNIVTNLPPLSKDRYDVQLGGCESQMPFHATYDAAPENEPFLITGSNDTLEISVKNGSANERLGTTPGQIVTIL